MSRFLNNPALDPPAEEINRVFEWLGRHCADLDSPIVEAGALEICRQHQREIYGVEGDELDDHVKRLWRSYVSETRAAIWAMIRTASPIDGGHRRATDG